MIRLAAAHRDHDRHQQPDRPPQPADHGPQEEQHQPDQDGVDVEPDVVDELVAEPPRVAPPQRRHLEHEGEDDGHEERDQGAAAQHDGGPVRLGGGRPLALLVGRAILPFVPAGRDRRVATDEVDTASSLGCLPVAHLAGDAGRAGRRTPRQP